MPHTESKLTLKKVYPLEPGRRVQLKDLQKREDLNGTYGAVVEFNVPRGRYEVALE